MTDTPVRYRSVDEDSARWQRFQLRPDDIVITTRSKSGTTWMQMICALLVFRTPDLPRPLAELSPWLDWLVVPIDEVVADLDGRTHRRFVKTHTPLDGLPRVPGVTYITVCRHPLDMALSLYHQGDNLDRQRLAQLTGEPAKPAAARPEAADWLRGWIDDDPDPRQALDSLPGVLRHTTLAWRARHRPGHVLIHYDDLQADLTGQMASLADRLGTTIDPETLGELADAASFDQMRARGDRLAPDTQGVLKDRNAFFRRGRSGGGAALLDEADVARYHRRAAELAPPDVLAWLHGDRDGDPGPADPAGQ